MRVFVLCTGRCGSTTWARASARITNFTAAHESLSDRLVERVDYPDRHIEVDNRLSWFLGTLERLYGDEALYVHLTRDRDEVVDSYAARFRGKSSIVRAFAQGIVQRPEPPADDATRLAASRLCIDTVTDNITAFLAGKSNVVHASLPDLQPGFDEMWDRIGAEGNRDAAHAELRIAHNRRRRPR